MTRTALVLGGGGLTGIGWETGLLKGLADEGLDLAAADAIVGTSAGSVVGTQITSFPLDTLYDVQLSPPSPGLGASFNRMALLGALPAILPGSSRTRRRRLGAAAQRAHPGHGQERVDVIRDRVKISEWPQRDLRITAVNAETGELEVFTKSSGVDLAHAVAASCAVPMVWPTVYIDDVPYMDGGVRSPSNADVARDATERVIVIAPLDRALSKAGRATEQLKRCQAARQVVITPDDAAREAFGKNVLDPGKRADAARAGLRQAADVAHEIRRVWLG